jgi:hypothetical protein
MSDALDRSRRRLESGLAELRGACDCELAWKPRWSRWAVPLIAAAVGLTIGLGLRRALPRLDRGR